jgi:hypothetical protein
MPKGTNARYLKNLAAMQALGRRRPGPSNTQVQKGITELRARVAASLGVGYEGATSRFGGGGGGAISSPLTEEDAGTRTLHPNPRVITSTDGIFSIEVRDIRQMTLTDANSIPVVFIFDQPS